MLKPHVFWQGRRRAHICIEGVSHMHMSLSALSARATYCSRRATEILRAQSLCPTPAGGDGAADWMFLVAEHHRHQENQQRFDEAHHRARGSSFGV